MLGMFAILFICLYLAFVFPLLKKKPAESKTDEKTAVQVKKLWNIAQTSMRERKPLRAEKALLAILHVDEKNAAAYNRLGILYAKGQKFDEAIECFEIAQSLDNNASSLHNVGLIYLETGEYEKAIMAFKQALELEGGMPARYIALAKAEESIGNKKAALEALESAYNLEPSVSVLRQILAIHEAAEDAEAITTTTARIEALITENAKKKTAKKLRSRRLLSPRRPASTTRLKKSPAPQTRSAAASARLAPASARRTKSLSAAQQAKALERAKLARRTALERARIAQRKTAARARAITIAAKPASIANSPTVKTAPKAPKPVVSVAAKSVSKPHTKIIPKTK